MKHLLALSVALVFAPAAVGAQSAPVPAAADASAPNSQLRAAREQFRAQMQTARLQTRARLLAALTPAHRTAVANIFGQLALAANPNPRAAAQALDAVLAPAEKESILSIAAAERANMQALMQQQRATIESTLSAEQRAQMAQRDAQRQAFMQSHPRRAYVPDAGAIVLRTLGGFGGGPAGMHGHLM
jgi:hypothetical protein